MATVAASTIVRSSGPGQFDLVADNVQKLGAKTLTSSSWLDELKQQQAEFNLSNSKNNTEVNHPLVDSLKTKLVAYQDKTLVPPVGGNSSQKKVSSKIAFMPGKTSSQFVATTYASKMDLPNLNNGHWKSTWTIESSGNESATISGQVEIQTLSYEEGNTQMKTRKVFDPVTVNKVNNDLSEGVFQQIVNWENRVLEVLVGLHDGSAEHLRQIRRVLPITKTKMKWEVAVQRGVKHLKKTANKR